MKKKKEGMQTIIFEIHKDLKTPFDAHCERLGLSMAEVMRCYIVGIVNFDVEGVSVDAELTAMIDKLTKKRDALRP